MSERFARADIEQSIASRFEAQVVRFPQRIAPSAAGRAVTYEQLDAHASRIARALLDRDGGPRVALLMAEAVDERGEVGCALAVGQQPGAVVQCGEVGQVTGVASVQGGVDPAQTAKFAARLGSAEAGESVMRNVATTIGTTPTRRNTVSATMRAHSSMWKVPVVRKPSRRACQ